MISFLLFMLVLAGAVVVSAFAMVVILVGVALIGDSSRKKRKRIL